MSRQATSTSRKRRAPKPGAAKTETLNNLVVLSDTHCGCRLGLCPIDGVPLDDGGTYMPSPFQKKLYQMWRVFWDEFVPEATKGEPFGVVVNGDMVDGVHHGSTTQISHNLMDQAEVAYRMFAPIVDLCGGRFWMVRGTEAHVSQSAREEEVLGKRLGARPNTDGQYARWDLWKKIGERDRLVHFLHHIGTTGSQAYESTAVTKELVESFVEAARWRRSPPDMIVRSHRHRYIETTVATGSGGDGEWETSKATAVVTPCFQGKTPFTFKIPGARLSTPQIGGIVIREAHGELFVRPKVWSADRSEVE